MRTFSKEEIAEYRKRKETKDAGEKFAVDLIDIINSPLYKEQFIQAFLDKMTLAVHRSNQQEVGNFIFRLIAAWGQRGKENRFDPRNEHIVKFCQDIMEKQVSPDEHGRKTLAEQYGIYPEPAIGTTFLCDLCGQRKSIEQRNDIGICKGCEEKT